MSQHTRPIAPIDLLQLAAIVLIWGANSVLAKIALNELPPMLVVAGRFTCVLVLIGWCVKPIPSDKLPAFLLMVACVGPLHFWIQNIGLQMAHDIAPMVVAMQLWAPSSVLFAMLLLGERASWLRLTGVATAFAGVAGMTFDPVVFAQWQALAIVGAAALIYGVGTVMVRRMGAMLDVWSMQAWIALVGAPTMLLGSWTFEPNAFHAAANASWVAWGCVAFAGIASAIAANAMMFSLVQRYEVSRTTPYILLTPAVAFALAALVLGDTITPRIIVGALVTTGGVVLVALAERRFKPVAPSPD